MKHSKLLYILLIVVAQQLSCKKFLEIDPPKNSLVQETVFQNNDQATSAVKGIYATMAATSFASGNSSSVTCYAGVSSDELIGYSSTNIPFYENQLTADFSGLLSLYGSPYKIIYAANAVLEGLSSTVGVTPPVKDQLTGEALFARAFGYFYLVNMFGSVPLQLTTDYRITQVAPKAPINKIYSQIIEDLKSAEVYLSDDYPPEGRTRPNKSVVQALLSRTYLYLKDWENAEKYADLVLKKTNLYKLVNLDAVFLPNSQEAIWQLIPNINTNAQEGALFILQSTPTIVSLRNSFALNGFEANDKRQSSWVKSFTNSTGTYYYPFKYKTRVSTTTVEYSMVIRLAELYLIRAEARINQEKIDLGVADLNILRERARPAATPTIPNPLPPLLLTLNKNNALLAVAQERKVELFSEWGHRWFDLKRTDKATEVLAPLKTNWQPADMLYPIPQSEIDSNPNVK